MNHQRIAISLTRAIEQKQFTQAIDSLKHSRPIDTSDILALIAPTFAWQLLENLPNRCTILSYLALSPCG